MDRLNRGDLDGLRAPLDLLDEEVNAFVASVRPTLGEHRLRLHALDCLRRVVARLWPSASMRVELFGSMATGLYLPQGDFDLLISDHALLQHRTVVLLRTLESALVRSGFASSVRLVTNAKVPLVKLVTAPEFGSFAMDISFNSPKGPQGARESLRLLQELEDRQPGAKMRAKSLVFLVKALLDVKGLTEVRFGGLGGMGIFCLAVSFVQLDSRPLEERSPARDLLAFLFKYGYEFNYTQDCIITAGGGRIVRKSEMGFGRQKGAEDRLCIQHPVDPVRDLTSGTFEIDSVRRAFKQAYVELWGCISAEDFPTSRSMLACAGIRLSPDVMARRQANQDLLDGGSLERLAHEWDPQIGPDRTSLDLATPYTAQNGQHSSSNASSLSNGYLAPSCYPSPAIRSASTSAVHPHAYAQQAQTLVATYASPYGEAYDGTATSYRHVPSAAFAPFSPSGYPATPSYAQPQYNAATSAPAIFSPYPLPPHLPLMAPQPHLPPGLYAPAQYYASHS